MPARGSVRRLLATTGLVAIVASLAAPASLPATAETQRPLPNAASPAPGDVQPPAEPQPPTEAQPTQPNSQLPPISVTAPEPQRRAGNTPSRRAERGVQKRKPQVARRETQPQPSVQTSGADSSSTINAGNSGTASQQVLSLGKTGTKLEDLPVSVQIVPREILNQQAVTVLRDALYNASGVNFGGQDSLGYFDHFLIRGLNAQATDSPTAINSAASRIR